MMLQMGWYWLTPLVNRYFDLGEILFYILNSDPTIHWLFLMLVYALFSQGIVISDMECDC